jgi:hypothetical protein
MEMNDLKMLELAAKASGFLHVDYTNLSYDGKLGLQLVDSIGRHTVSWNPSQDDGDSFRLALSVNAEISNGHVTARREKIVANAYYQKGNIESFRFAILRVASGIGSTL